MSESSTGRRRPACLAAVPLCSRHTHLEHIGEYPAWRGHRVSRRFAVWGVAGSSGPGLISSSAALPRSRP
jgi:hypothetical protein